MFGRSDFLGARVKTATFPAKSGGRKKARGRVAGARAFEVSRGCG
jgi:hypothetical protein